MKMFKIAAPFLILLLMFTGCAKVEDLEEDVVGSWRFNQVDYSSDLGRASCPDCLANLTEEYEGQILEFNEDKKFFHLDANDSTLFAGDWVIEQEQTNYFDRFGEVKAANFTLRLNVTDPPAPGNFLIRNTTKKKLDLIRIDTLGTYYMIMKPL